MDHDQGRKLEFKTGSPFHDIVAAFLAATTGLGHVFDPNNPMNLSPNVRSLYQGKIQKLFSIDQEQVHKTALALSVNETVSLLCCMVANAAYESVRRRLQKSPEAEVLRHVRNAASHGNHFNFSRVEPHLPATWRGFGIDHSRKGKDNPLYGARCFGETMGPADLVVLLWDVERTMI